MKTIGLIGGTSWISTVEYYRAINLEVNQRLGGSSSARLLLYSVNHAEFHANDDTDWDDVADRLAAIAMTLEKAGADCLLLCANTMHMVSDSVQARIDIPLIHIAVQTAKEIRKRNIEKVALLGTRFTMEESFFKDKLCEEGVTALMPDDADRAFINSSIFSELAKGIFTPQTKERYIRIIDKMIGEGAGGVILGCTEIPLLVNEKDLSVPAFDTGAIHAHAAVEFALASPIKEIANEQLHKK